MQPLSYQTTEKTCWETSIVNGINLLLGNGRLCPLYAYRMLHYFVWKDIEHYYEERRFMRVIRDIEKFTGLKVSYHEEHEVAGAVDNLHFDEQVAVCDVYNGKHSILLNDRDGEWFAAFDPWWYEHERHDDSNLKFPICDPFVNVKIRRSHLLANRLDKGWKTGRSYQMGRIMGRRFVTILSKR